MRFLFLSQSHQKQTGPGLSFSQSRALLLSPCSLCNPTCGKARFEDHWVLFLRKCNVCLSGSRRSLRRDLPPPPIPCAFLHMWSGCILFSSCPSRSSIRSGFPGPRAPCSPPCPRAPAAWSPEPVQQGPASWAASPRQPSWSRCSWTSGRSW